MSGLSAVARKNIVDGVRVSNPKSHRIGLRSRHDHVVVEKCDERIEQSRWSGCYANYLRAILGSA